MADKFIKFFLNTKVIITTIGIIASGSVYAYNYLHKDYLTNIGIKKILNQNSIENSIQDNLNNITDLRINQGYATTKKDQYKYDILIKVKEVRILALKERLKYK